MVPSLARRLASMAYEALLVAAIVVGGAFVFFGAVAGINAVVAGSAAIEAGPILRAGFQLFAAALVGGYFVRSWTHGGQTLPMKAWKLRLTGPNGAPPARGRATRRYLLALGLLGPAPIAAGYSWRHPDAVLAWLVLAASLLDLAWALVDRDGQFLHDRLAGTRIVRSPPPSAGGAPG